VLLVAPIVGAVVASHCTLLPTHPYATRSWPIRRIDHLTPPAATVTRAVRRVAAAVIAVATTAVVASTRDAEPETQANGRATVPVATSATVTSRRFSGCKGSSDNGNRCCSQKHFTPGHGCSPVFGCSPRPSAGEVYSFRTAGGFCCEGATGDASNGQGGVSKPAPAQATPFD
jgi:hypothetical protein